MQFEGAHPEKCGVWLLLLRLFVLPGNWGLQFLGGMHPVILWVLPYVTLGMTPSNCMHSHHSSIIIIIFIIIFHHPPSSSFLLLLSK
jgi:hypothetical protein